MLRLAVILVLSILAQQTFADEPEAIVGGTSASPGEYPHQVSLQLRGLHFCGGSIITPNKILSAAHCIFSIVNEPYNDFVVVTGSIDKYKGTTHRVKNTRVNPKYVPEASHSWVHDVAVITLFEPIKFDKYQSAIDLTASAPVSGTLCTLSGWGRIKADGQSPQNLLKMETTLIDNKSCQTYFTKPISNTHLCAFTKSGIGACHGDSGGALICNGRQYGIISFVRPCAVGVPDVYTSVYHDLSFIKQCIAGY